MPEIPVPHARGAAAARPDGAQHEPVRAPWVCVSVRWDADVAAVRRRAEAHAASLGVRGGDCCVVGAAVAELARNLVRHAGWGVLLVGAEETGGRRAVVIIASDRGLGIGDVGLAMQDGYSTCGDDGVGLPSVQRLMDDFEIVSHPGRGTSVTARKWVAVRDSDDRDAGCTEIAGTPLEAARPDGPEGVSDPWPPDERGGVQAPDLVTAGACEP